MKKIFFAFLLAFTCLACSKDDSPSIEGTKWQHSGDFNGISCSVQYEFKENTFWTKTKAKHLDGIHEREEVGTYTYVHPKVTLTYSYGGVEFAIMKNNAFTIGTDVYLKYY